MKKLVTNYKSVDIYAEKGHYEFYIGSFRFAAESMDEAQNIIDRYGRDDEGDEE